MREGDALRGLAAAVPGLPLATFFLLGSILLLARAPSERFTARLVQAACALPFMITLALAVARTLARAGAPAWSVSIGEWFSSGDYTFDVTLLLDRLSLTVDLLVGAVTTLIARFSRNQLHREAGFTRFYMLLSLFAAGMHLLVLSGGIDILFVGWEMVGLSSMLLIAFFYDRGSPVRNSLRVFTTYRLCDLGLLVAAVLLHRWTHTDEFVDAFAAGSLRRTPSSPWSLNLFGLLLLLGASGTSAQLPFGHWLPRAMEGPTPSSALLYCSLSVHAGVFLLLRAEPLLRLAPVASVVIACVGGLTAAYGALVWRVQRDARSAIAHATMAHLGLMLVEIGLGLYVVALAHLMLHACLRCYQMLRAPSRFGDLALRRPRAVSRGAPPARVSRWLPERVARALWKLAHNRFYLEAMQERWLVDPVVRTADWAERVEGRWDDFVGGRGDALSDSESASQPSPTSRTTQSGHAGHATRRVVS